MTRELDAYVAFGTTGGGPARINFTCKPVLGQARSRDGEAVAMGLVEKEIAQDQPFLGWGMRAMLTIPTASALYEMEDPQPERVFEGNQPLPLELEEQPAWVASDPRGGGMIRVAGFAARCHARRNRRRRPAHRDQRALRGGTLEERGVSRH